MTQENKDLLMKLLQQHKELENGRYFGIRGR